jgi:hypothetical protein
MELIVNMVYWVTTLVLGVIETSSKSTSFVPFLKTTFSKIAPF